MNAFSAFLLALIRRIKNVRKRTVALAILAAATVWSATSDVSSALDSLFAIIIENYGRVEEGVDGKPFISDDIGDRSKFLAYLQ